MKKSQSISPQSTYLANTKRMVRIDSKGATKEIIKAAMVNKSETFSQNTFSEKQRQEVLSRVQNQLSEFTTWKNF